MMKFSKQSILTKRLVFVNAEAASIAMAQEGEKFKKVPEAMKAELDALKEEKIKDTNIDDVAKAKQAEINAIYNNAMKSDVINPEVGSKRLFDKTGVSEGLASPNLDNFQTARNNALSEVKTHAESFKEKQTFITEATDIALKKGPDLYTNTTKILFETAAGDLKPILEMKDSKNLTALEASLKTYDSLKFVDEAKEDLKKYDTMLATLNNPKFKDLAVAKSAIEKIEGLKTKGQQNLDKMVEMRDHAGRMLQAMRGMAEANGRWGKKGATKEQQGKASVDYARFNTEFKALSGEAAADLKYTAPESAPLTPVEGIKAKLLAEGSREKAYSTIVIDGQTYQIARQENRVGDKGQMPGIADADAFYIRTGPNKYESDTGLDASAMATLIEKRIAEAEFKKMTTPPEVVSNAPEVVASK